MSQNNGGVGAGTVLFAPQSGEKTRQKLLQYGDDARETVGRVPHAMREAEKAAVATFSETLKKG
jgi:gas vesicle protein